MKYLLLILVATAFVGTASAASRGCCTGGACCRLHLSCCGE